MLIKCIGLFLLGLLVVACVNNDLSSQVYTLTEDVATYKSGGNTVTIERFFPKSEVKKPGIILVHGADSLLAEKWSELYHNQARLLVKQGFVVFLPHYLESTQTKLANMANIIQNFQPWMTAISDAISYANNQPQVKEGNLGLVGVSLGASLVLSESAFDPRIGAVVEFFGALPDWVLPVAKGKREPALPPILILHGDSDRLVSVNEANKLAKTLDRYKLPYQMQIYPKQGHGFQGDADTDAQARMVSFLKRYL